MKEKLDAGFGLLLSKRRNVYLAMVVTIINSMLCFLTNMFVQCEVVSFVLIPEDGGSPLIA